MTTKTLDFTNIERKLFWILAGAIVVAVGFYLYSAISLTIAVIDRDNALSSTRTLSAQVAGLEQQYMEVQNTVTLSVAQEKGFKEVAPRYTGSVSPDTLALSR